MDGVLINCPIESMPKIGSLAQHQRKSTPGQKSDKRPTGSNGYQISYNVTRSNQAMGIQQIFFSKLIKACEQNWIPETDFVYGEPTFTKQLPKGLKKLIYEPKKNKSDMSKIRTKVIGKRLSSNKLSK